MNEIIKIHNATTGQVTERPLNAKELAIYEQNKQQEIATRQAESEKAEARSAAEAKLIALGLTVDDLKALLG